VAGVEDAGKRLDQFLTARLNGVSRARVQELINGEKILVNDLPAKASFKLRGGERIEIFGEAHRPALKAVAENVPLDIIYEDDDLAVINKPAGMMVHAGAGASDDSRNRGTLVNALLHHFGGLSGLGGELRPGIVHRLDKETSGLIVVAKNDEAHRRLAAQFAARKIKKKYVALVHGWVKNDSGTIYASISRDRLRRTRMTTRVAGGREAITHYRVGRRLDTRFGSILAALIRFACTWLRSDIRWSEMRRMARRKRCERAQIAHPLAKSARRTGPRPRYRCRATFSMPRNWNSRIRARGNAWRSRPIYPKSCRNSLHKCEVVSFSSKLRYSSAREQP